MKFESTDQNVDITIYLNYLYTMQLPPISSNTASVQHKGGIHF